MQYTQHLHFGRGGAGVVVKCTPQTRFLRMWRTPFPQAEQEGLARQEAPGLQAGAGNSRVNRTQKVVLLMPQELGVLGRGTARPRAQGTGGEGGAPGRGGALCGLTPAPLV